MDISATNIPAVDIATLEKILICDIANQDIYYIYKDKNENYYNESGKLININDIPHSKYKYAYY